MTNQKSGMKVFTVFYDMKAGRDALVRGVPYGHLNEAPPVEKNIFVAAPSEELAVAALRHREQTNLPWISNIRPTFLYDIDVVVSVQP